MRRRLASLLIGLGVVGLLLSAVTVSRRRTLARAGPVRLTVQEQRTPVVPRWLGGALLLAGLGLLVAERRHRARRPPHEALQLPERQASDLAPADAGERSELIPRRPDRGSAAEPGR